MCLVVVLVLIVVRGDRFSGTGCNPRKKKM